MSCTTDPAPTYQKIVAKCHAVTEYFIDTSDRESDFPFSSLRPFLSPRLTRLAVYPNSPLSYDAIDIEELARSLPLIEDLDLGTKAMKGGKPLGTFTFDHLLLFSSYCPRLTKLGMLLDVTKECNPSPPNFIPFSALQELDLAGSFLIDQSRTSFVHVYPLAFVPPREHFAMSPDHVLGTPELLFQILSYSTNAAVVKGLQVSQFWFAVGKPIIWGAISSNRHLWHLLLILIPYDQRRITFDLPSDKEWERFLQYSTLVRYLFIDLSDGSPYTISVLRYLIESRPVIEVFPTLDTLKCKNNINMVYPSAAFLHSGVQRWILDVGGWDYTFENWVQLRNLTHIELAGFITAEDLLHIFAGVEVLPLETISLPPYTATYGVLASLSRFPSLREIKSLPLRHGYFPCSGNHHNTSRLRVGAFPRLIALTVSGCPLDLSKLFDDENFPFHIRSLQIANRPCTYDPGPIYRQIVTKCPAVVEFVLRDSSVDTYSSFAFLRPFFSFSLTSLTIRPYRELPYSAVEIEELMRSLPLLEHLKLGSNVTSPNSPRGNLTFDHLVQFSRYCPNLTKLSIRPNASEKCDPSPPNLIPFANLRELDLGLTFGYTGRMSVDDFERIGTLLSNLLPAHCEVVCNEKYCRLQYYDPKEFDRALAHLKRLCGRNFRLPDGM
ncbi:hypothetical protein H0H92_014303 [Tricholoma furcatifolium]|nr:hypothetical protein H0H92_014303 [Tricholoma furcatifolium]